jgi:hypothetical protein
LYGLPFKGYDALMVQALRKFSDDEVRQFFSRTASVSGIEVAGALDELARHASHWKISSGGLIAAIDDAAATFERNIAGGFESDDVDRFVDDLQIQESKENAARAAFEKISFAKVDNSDLLLALNEALALYLDLSRSVSQAYHDARWRLMEARARFNPSLPTGEIFGDPTDLDTLIKS